MGELETTDSEQHTGYLIGIGICLLYPLVYDGTQLIKQGPTTYLKSIWNYNDVFHILGGYLNIYTQIYFGPFNVYCQSLTVILIVMMLFKLFFFLRIYKKLSVITTMIMTCMYDLKVFMIFFLILTTFFGMMMNVISPNP